MFPSSFSNRPAVDIKFLPDNFNLNTLRTSGWYAPRNSVLNEPDDFQLYHLFVVAPNPDVYVTQMAFGVSYIIKLPSSTEGDESIVENEVIRDKNGNIVYTQNRVAADFDDDGVPDTGPSSLIFKVGEDAYNIVRLVTDDDIEYDVVGAENVEIPAGSMIVENQDGQNFILNNKELTAVDSSTVDNIITKDITKDLSSKDLLITASDIIEDEPQIIITNRSAISTRSYTNGAWTAWTSLSAGAASTIVDQDATVEIGDTVNWQRLYAYVDTKLAFSSLIPNVTLYGLQVEVTGTYNNAPYDPDANAYGVEASGIEYDSIGDLPDEGDPEKLYIVKSENRLYRWDENSGKYWCCGSDYNEIAHLLGGTAASEADFDDPELP